ncbi:MAG: phosphate regulon sensor histidine kinase PhoR [Steroidobacteraceae bacterium]
MNSASIWWPQVLRALFAVLVGVGAGLVFAEPWLGLAVVLALLLGFQIRHLARLLHWLKTGQVELAPDLPGPWGELVAKILRLYRRKQFHRQRLLRLLRELRRSTAAMPDGVVVLNPQTEILWFNRTAARLLGFRGKGDIGLRIENLVRAPEFVRYLRGAQYAMPVVVRSTAGPERHLSLQIVPYGAGQLLTLVRDVTREARLEAMRRDFVANASHELRSPLTVISGYLETLAQEPGAGALEAPLQEMRRQAARMNRIVQDLLELSRLESSTRAAPARPIDVVALMGQLRRDARARTAPKPALTVRVQPDSHARLLGDELQIHSAFANLVDNAVQYTAGGGSVQLRWWTDAQGGHFSVTDSGIGIAREHLPRLTERFYRVDPGRSRSTGGSGLGLAIVKHVLQRHGGQLSVQSEEGRGSRFCCHFPPARLQHAESAADTGSAHAAQMDAAAADERVAAQAAAGQAAQRPA